MTVTQEALFDFDAPTAEDADTDWWDEAVSCLCCHVVTTPYGLVDRGHGPGTVTCARWRKAIVEAGEWP